MRIGGVILDQVPDAPANLPPADVPHHLIHLDPGGARIDMVGADKLHARPLILGAGHADRNLGRRVGDDFRLEMAAIQDVIGNARPLVIIQPALRAWPNLISAVICPTGFDIILRLRQNFPLQILVHKEVLIVAKLELDGASSNVRGDVQGHQAIAELIDVPALELSLFNLCRIRRSRSCHG